MIDLTDSSAEAIAERFRALAEPVRLRLLNNLRDGEMSVGDLAERVGTGQANASKHLQILMQQGFVERRKDGTINWYRIGDPAVFDLCSLVGGGIEQVLERRRKQLRRRG